MRNKSGFIFALSFFLSIQLNAQTRISAPNTLFGIGELQTEKNSSLLVHGGSAIGLRDPMTINFSNPASYSAIKPQSFIFEANIAGNFKKQINDYQSQTYTYGSPGNMQFGFPIFKAMGASFGFKPYSKVGYKITEEDKDDYFGRFTNTYEGSGGIDLFYMGLALKPHKNISVGVNAAYTIGKIDRQRIVDFKQDSIPLYGFKQNVTIYPRGFIFDYGIQLEKEIATDLKGVVGFTFTPSSSLNAEEYTTNQTFVNRYYFKDTISTNIVDNELILPKKMGGGLSLIKKEKWLISTSYSVQNWKDYTYAGENDPHLKEQKTFTLGSSFTPDRYDLKYLYKRLKYNVGLRYTENYTELSNHPFNEFGISFGLGLPLYKRRAGASIISFGIEKGRRGNIEDNGYKENFTNFVFSIKIYEIWFLKSKYD